MRQCPNCSFVCRDSDFYCIQCNHKLPTINNIIEPEYKPVKSVKSIQQKSTPTIECPYCKSTDTQKISGMSRAGSIVVWGIFSKKLGKQWHCNKCGSDF